MTESEPPRGASLTSKTARGFVWMFGQSMALKLVNTFGQIVLAWLLAPEIWGLIALTSTIGVFADQFRQMGIRPVLIHRQGSYHRWANAAFWMSMALGFGATTIMVVAAKPVALLYGEPELVGLIMALSLTFPFSALAEVPFAKLQIDLRFRALAVVGFGKITGITLLTIIFAWMGMGAYSFVWAPVIIAVLRAAVLLWLAFPPIRPTLQFRRWRFMLGDLTKVFAAMLLQVFQLQAAYIVLGIFQTTEAAGLYLFSVNLADQTIRHITIHLGTVLFPALAKLQEDSTRQTMAFLRACRLLALVAVPLCFLQAGLASPFVHLVLEDKWIAAIPIMQILSIGAAVRVTSAPSISMIQAQGRFGLLLRLNVVYAIGIFAAVTPSAAFAGVVMVAFGAAAVHAVVSPVQTYLAIRPTGGRWRDVAAVYAMPVAIGGVAVGVGVFASTFVPVFRGKEIVEALVIIAITAAIYLPLVRVLCPADTDDLRQRIRGFMPARLKRSAA